MIKKNKTYQKLNLQQSKLKSLLHKNIRTFLKFIQKNPDSKKIKAPITISELKKQETKINHIRKKITRHPISLIKNLEITLTHLK